MKCFSDIRFNYLIMWVSGSGSIYEMGASTRQSILGVILDHKYHTELPARKRMVDERTLRNRAEDMNVPARDFAASLHRLDGRVALIAEVKRASPSKGDLVNEAFDPVNTAVLYEQNGASGISVLTDARFFKGSLDDLIQVRMAVNVPVLRKDFIVDPYQIYEARTAGADAILLIVAALDDAQFADLHQLAITLTLTPLVEVHNEGEVERAMKVGASVVGVNNRDLHTFVTDLDTTARCARLLKGQAQRPVIVSESGIFTQQHVRSVAMMGANAVLVGESIITSGEMARQVRLLSSVDATPEVEP